MSRRCAPRDVAAAVVTYHPSLQTVRRIARLARRLEALYVVDNSPGAPSAALRQLAGVATIRLIRMAGNRGIATALNTASLHAERDGYRWLLTLDQDSRVPSRLALQLRHAVVGDGATIGIVAPPIWDDWSARRWSETGRLLAPRHRCVITSGCLVRLQAWRDIGGYDDSLFIDGVDYDFCQRLGNAGWDVQLIDCTPLKQRIGRRDRYRLGPFKGSIRRYPPQRRYFQGRNGVLLVRRHWHADPAWAFAYALRMLLVDMKLRVAEPANVTEAWVRGLRHGWRRPAGFAPDLPPPMTQRRPSRRPRIM